MTQPTNGLEALAAKLEADTYSLVEDEGVTITYAIKAEDRDTILTALRAQDAAPVATPALVSEGFAVLRDAARQDQRDTKTWVRISPEEARQIRSDLTAARAALAHPSPNPAPQAVALAAKLEKHA